MSDVKIELNSAGIRELLKSAEIASVCEEEAHKVASRCGAGYKVDTYTGKTRVNAMVSADTKEAYRDNLKNNTLLKALGG